MLKIGARPRTRRIPVLMYHKIGDCPPGTRFKSDWTSARAFRRQLERLKSRGFVSLLFSELRDAELGKIPMPLNPALITFDDGYANQHRNAYPVLRELGMKGNIFLICGCVGGDNRWDSGEETAAPIPMLSWAQIREMRDSNAVEFGSHTMSHRDLMKLPIGDIRWELTESKKRLEAELGREVLGFSYPFGTGAYDPVVRTLAREAGYRYDFGTRPGISSLPWDPAAGPLMRVEPARGIRLLSSEDR